MMNPVRGAVSANTGAFNPYAAGSKKYGGGRPMPTTGAVADKAGYGRRDALAEARKNALIQRASGGTTGGVAV